MHRKMERKILGSVFMLILIMVPLLSITKGADLGDTVKKVWTYKDNAIPSDWAIWRNSTSSEIYATNKEIKIHTYDEPYEHNYFYSKDQFGYGTYEIAVRTTEQVRGTLEYYSGIHWYFWLIHGFSPPSQAPPPTEIPPPPPPPPNMTHHEITMEFTSNLNSSQVAICSGTADTGEGRGTVITTPLSWDDGKTRIFTIKWFVERGIRKIQYWMGNYYLGSYSGDAVPDATFRQMTIGLETHSFADDPPSTFTLYVDWIHYEGINHSPQNEAFFSDYVFSDMSRYNYAGNDNISVSNGNLIFNIPKGSLNGYYKQMNYKDEGIYGEYKWAWQSWGINTNTYWIIRIHADNDNYAQMVFSCGLGNNNVLISVVKNGVTVVSTVKTVSFNIYDGTYRTSLIRIKGDRNPELTFAHGYKVLYSTTSSLEILLGKRIFPMMYMLVSDGNHPNDWDSQVTVDCWGYFTLGARVLIADICGMYDGVILPIPDGVVDLDDFMMVAVPGIIFTEHPTWNPVWGPTCDVNKDGKVGVADLIIVALHFGEHL